ncbi:hypothetical protein KA529_02315 [Candidatus Saccharibacteria bacterium]|nr:hypothetical protein [Candidatus Saccharibacteria bacterium]
MNYPEGTKSFLSWLIGPRFKITLPYMGNRNWGGPKNIDGQRNQQPPPVVRETHVGRRMRRS